MNERLERHYEASCKALSAAYARQRYEEVCIRWYEDRYTAAREALAAARLNEVFRREGKK